MKLMHESVRDAVKGTLTVVGIEAHWGEIKRELYQELRRTPRRQTSPIGTLSNAHDP